MGLNRKLKVLIRQNLVELVKSKLNSLNQDEIFLLAAAYGRLEIINLITNVSPKVLNSGFYKVCRHGHLILAKWFLTKPVNFIFGLRIACIQGHKDLVEFFINHNIDYHSHQELAFRIAVDFNQIEVIKVLLKQGVDVNFKEGYVFKQAIQKQNFELIKLLLGQDVKFNTNLIISLYECNQPEMTQLLLNDNRTLPYIGDVFVLACLKNLIKVAEILFPVIEANDSPVNASHLYPYRLSKIDNDKSSYLFEELCLYDSVEIVKILLRFTGSRYVNTNNGEYIINTCNSRYKDPYRVIKFLLNLGRSKADRYIKFNQDTAFIKACERGNIQTVKILLKLTDDRRVNIHSENEQAFIGACRYGRIEVVKLLLSLGRSEAETSEAQLERTIDVHAQNEAAFILACRYAKVEVVKLLLSLGQDRYIDVHAQNEKALHSVCSATFGNNYQALIVVKLLLDLKEDRRFSQDLTNSFVAAYINEKINITAFLLSLPDDRYIKVPKELFNDRIHRVTKDLIDPERLAIRSIRQHRRWIRINRQNMHYRIRFLRCIQELLATPPGELHFSFPGGSRYHQLIQNYM